MSSILKALKKLEQEKAARRPDAFRIDAEILRGGQPRRLFPTGASLAAIALFLCGVGGTYLYMRHDNTPAPVQQSHSSNTGIKGESSTGSTRLPVSTDTAEQPHPAPPARAVSVPEKTVPSARSIEKQQQTLRERPAESVPQAALPEPKSVPPSVPVAPAVVPAKPVLKVSGIAFQDGSESAAVINGITVSNGSMIEGARVEEIQKDRVRLSRGGEMFEIILDKSN